MSSVTPNNNMPVYSADPTKQKQITDQIAKLQAEQAAGKVNKQDVQDLYQMMKTAGANGGDIFANKAANGATYGDLIHDLDIAAQGGDMGKAGQDLYGMVTQLADGKASGAYGVPETIAKQAAGSALMTRDTLGTKAGRETFAKAWGDGNTPFAQDVIKADPGMATWKGVKLSTASDDHTNGVWDQIGKHMNASYGMDQAGGGKVSIMWNPNTTGDHSMVVVNQGARTVQGFDATGARQGTDNYNTVNGQAQYVSSGDVSIKWGAYGDKNNTAWGIDDPKKSDAGLWGQPTNAVQG